MIVRILAYVLLVLAIASGGVEAVSSIGAGAWEPFSAGEAWYLIHRDSLNLVQAAVQRHIASELWDWVFLPILTLPLWVVLGVPALLLFWVAKPRTRSRFFPRRNKLL